MLKQFYHKRAMLVDLEEQKTTVLALNNETLDSCIGGAGLAEHFLALYPDALILSGGPFTGSFLPASGLLVVSTLAKGCVRHCVVTNGHGAGLRRSGVDLLIITGTGNHEQVIVCKTMACDLVSSELLGIDGDIAYSRTRMRRRLLGQTPDGLAYMILRGQTASRAVRAGAALEYGLSENAGVLHDFLWAKKITAIVLQGQGPLPPIPVGLNNSISSGITSGSSIFAKTLTEALQSPVVSKLHWKGAACFHCPAPCRAWVKVSQNLYLQVTPPGTLAPLLADHEDRLAELLGVADELGLDVFACSAALAGCGKEEKYVDYVRNRLQLHPAESVYSEIIPEQEEDGQMHDHAIQPDNVKAGLLLGICPLFLKRFPEVTVDRLAGFLPDPMATHLIQAVS